MNSIRRTNGHLIGINESDLIDIQNNPYLINATVS
jgi:hypothetical protein